MEAKPPAQIKIRYVLTVGSVTVKLVPIDAAPSVELNTAVGSVCVPFVGEVPSENEKSTAGLDVEFVPRTAVPPTGETALIKLAPAFSFAGASVPTVNRSALFQYAQSEVPSAVRSLAAAVFEICAETVPVICAARSDPAAKRPQRIAHRKLRVWWFIDFGASSLRLAV